MIEVTRKVENIIFSTRVDPELVHHGKWLLSAIEEMHHKGPPLSDGSTIEMGWSVLNCIQRDDGVLEICEPNFANNPLCEIVNTTNVTLTVLSQQNSNHDRLSVPRCHVRYDQTLIIDPDIYCIDKIYMVRNEPSISTSSGWYIGNDESPSADNVKTIFVYDLLNISLAALSLVALPQGYFAIIDDGKIVTIADEAENEIWNVDKGNI